MFVKPDEPDQAVTSSLGLPQGTAEAIGQQLASVDFRPLYGLPIAEARPGLTWAHSWELAKELRILKGALFRQCLQAQPSFILWRIFFALSGKRKKLLYRAFILNEALSVERWADLIGPQSFETWRALSLLEQHENGFSCIARVAYTGHSAIILDHVGRKNPLYGKWREHQHVYFGGDSLVFLEFCLKHIKGLKRDRYLDVGVGAGAILCGLAPFFQTAVGIDINPRAVQLARLNAKINKLENVRTEEADAIRLNEPAERYDLVTWNLPYLLRPKGIRRTFSDGGELGIGLAIRFMQRVPDFLNPEGVAFVMVSSPILIDGRRPLIERLQQIASIKEMDIQIINQFYLGQAEHKEFLLANDVRATEIVILVARKGKGSVVYVSRSLMGR